MRYPLTPDAKPVILPYGEQAPRIAEDAYIAPGAVVIGDVDVANQASIWFGCVVRGDEHCVRIGARSNLQDGTVVHVSGRKQGTYIGDDVTVGHMALLHACTLEDGSYVGMGAQVMDEAVVETGAMLAAGALLTSRKRVKSGELWAGRPAVFMRAIPPDEALRLQKTAKNYAEKARQYLEGGGIGANYA